MSHLDEGQLLALRDGAVTPAAEAAAHLAACAVCGEALEASRLRSLAVSGALGALDAGLDPGHDLARARERVRLRVTEHTARTAGAAARGVPPPPRRRRQKAAARYASVAACKSSQQSEQSGQMPPELDPRKQTGVGAPHPGQGASGSGAGACISAQVQIARCSSQNGQSVAGFGVRIGRRGRSDVGRRLGVRTRREV